MVVFSLTVTMILLLVSTGSVPPPSDLIACGVTAMRDMESHRSCSLFEHQVLLLQLIRDCAIGAHRVGHAVRQNELPPVERGGPEKRVPLIDQIKNRSDDECDKERAPRHAVGYRAPAGALPDRMRTHSNRSHVHV